MLKLIILDRDGVINEDSDAYIKSCAEWRAIDGSIEAIVKLQKHGYKVAIATNQSGVARNYLALAELNLIHDKMIAAIKNAGGEFSQENIFICPHKPEDNCECRKPKPGLLIQAANYFNINSDEILFVGDAERDILAAKAFGARAALVITGKGKKTLEQSGIENAPDNCLSYVQCYEPSAVYGRQSTNILDCFAKSARNDEVTQTDQAVTIPVYKNLYTLVNALVEGLWN